MDIGINLYAYETFTIHHLDVHAPRHHVFGI